MSEGGVPPIHACGFAAEVNLAEPVALTLRGTADSTTSNALTTLVHRLHSQIVDLRARAVLVDITQMEFMNTSSFNVLVDWLTRVGELPAGERYVLRFRSDAAQLWQQRTLNTLACFAPQLVEREV